MTLKTYKRLALVLTMLGFVLAGCKIYSFKDVSIPPDVKTIKVNYIENRARYINPSLSPQITSRLQEKIIQQTKLQQVDDANADWVISGYISSYDITTSGISDRQTTSNRLNVTVSITKFDNVYNKKQDISVSRAFDFRSGASLQEAENELGDELIKGITDEIFNRIFSDW